MERIVINEALMFLRKYRLHKSAETNEPADSTINPCFEEHLDSEYFYRLIRRLPGDLRTVFNMYAIDGFSHKEIARELNIKEESSRVYLTRARKILQDFLEVKLTHHG